MFLPLPPKKPMSEKAKKRLEQREEATRCLQRFIEWVSKRPAPHFIFRGQADVQWPLRPSVGREPKRYALEKELQMLTIFKRQGRQHLSHGLVTSDWDWLTVAQHHGLPTRLLDWTTNALVAAYFCSAAEKDFDGVVFSLSARKVKFIDIAASNTGPFDITEPVFFYPSVLATRISTQRGLFSAHPEPSEPYKVASIDKFVFPAALKSDIL